MEKEAFERAKSAYGTGAYDDATLEFVFPQLRESEDERIRKEIIEVLRLVPSSMWEEAKTDYERCLTYLEQKENPKTADSIPSDCTSDAKCEDRWHKVGDSLPDNPREVLCKDEAGNYFIGRYYVGEGWEISNYDDEDKPHHLNPPVSKWIDFPLEKQKEPLTPEEKMNHWLYLEGFDVGKKVGETLKEQKPVEWNANDKAFIKDCARILDENGYAASAERLLSMFPIRPAEWSEEDEKMLSVISYKISQHQGCDDRSLFTPNEAEFIDRLEDKLNEM